MLLLCCLSCLSVSAQDGTQNSNKSNVRPNPQSKPKFYVCKEGYELPDLTITNIEVLKSNEIVITVKNIGLCPAPPTVVDIINLKELKDEPTYTTQKPSEDRQARIDKKSNYHKVQIPALKSNQSYKIKKLYYQGLEPGSGGGAWELYQSGYFSHFKFMIDYYEKIHEADEYNNEYTLKPPPITE
jgi:hypothetical protein